MALWQWPPYLTGAWHSSRQTRAARPAAPLSLVRKIITSGSGMKNRWVWEVDEGEKGLSHLGIQHEDCAKEHFGVVCAGDVEREEAEQLVNIL